MIMRIKGIIMEGVMSIIMREEMEREGIIIIRNGKEKVEMEW
jgi:hypothetical protein